MLSPRRLAMGLPRRETEELEGMGMSRGEVMLLSLRELDYPILLYENVGKPYLQIQRLTRPVGRKLSSLDQTI